MAQGSRLGHCSKVISYLGYTGCDTRLFSTAALDPERSSRRAGPYITAAIVARLRDLLTTIVLHWLAVGITK
jgi:hypothetical protein